MRWMGLLDFMLRGRVRIMKTMTIRTLRAEWWIMRAVRHFVRTDSFDVFFFFFLCSEFVLWLRMYPDGLFLAMLCFWICFVDCSLYTKDCYAFFSCFISLLVRML
ncbi:hypothetical protein HPP92_001853 [Vanilla planifolia]|uniref:Uncharacterized protein n=1 Tax=Vanilla planifolia TaxID=51239 RepID=A0A835S8J1_VANPL|nr:hypothetical protein HPP92_001853 [Vanilla planifolia]